MMIERNIEDSTLFQFPHLAAQPRLAHAVTARPWNMAPHRGPDASLAVERRKTLCIYLGISFDRLTAPEQVHSPEVIPVDAADVGAGRFGRQHAVRHVDGLVTDQEDLPILILCADCPVVVVYDPGRPAVGAAHASWRGTVAGITPHLVRTMVELYGSDPTRLLAGIGPSAGPCCYEVGPDVGRIVSRRFDEPARYLVTADGRTHLDLWRANTDQLLAAGLLEHNIHCASLCSICDSRFFSHRRDGADTGRFALIAAIIPGR
jgi:polyphenol oxidase